MPVNWLWEPYIAIGKITLLQGDHKQFGIEYCGFASSGLHQLPEENAEEHCGIKSKDMVRLIYQICG